MKLGADEFAARMHQELDRCAVGRDNPVHRMLVAGTMDRAVLRTFAIQQWAFHVAFPSTLALLARGCPDRAWRARLLRDAYEQDREPGKAGRVAQWEAVCAAWGLTRQELAAGPVLVRTEAMLAVQEHVAGRPFGEAFAGLTIAVNGEAAPHIAARRAAMEQHYGVSGAALAYFEDFVPGDCDALLASWIELADRYCVNLEMQENALRAVRLVLRARWDYFSGLAMA